MNDVAAPPPRAAVDDGAGRRLSFAFAKRHGVLVNRVIDGVAECTDRDTASPQALAEVRRYLRRSVRLERQCSLTRGSVRSRRNRPALPSATRVQPCSAARCSV